MGVGDGNADDDVDNDNNARLFASFNRVRFIAKTMAIKIWTMRTTDGVLHFHPLCCCEVGEDDASFG